MVIALTLHGIQGRGKRGRRRRGGQLRSVGRQEPSEDGKVDKDNKEWWKGKRNGKVCVCRKPHKGSKSANPSVSAQRSINLSAS